MLRLAYDVESASLLARADCVQVGRDIMKHGKCQLIMICGAALLNLTLNDMHTTHHNLLSFIYMQLMTLYVYMYVTLSDDENDNCYMDLRDIVCDDDDAE